MAERAREHLGRHARHDVHAERDEQPGRQLAQQLAERDHVEVLRADDEDAAIGRRRRGDRAG